MPIDKEASRLWRGRIRDVLNRQWDPIGGCPADEYDSYVGTIAAMLLENADDAALLKYLDWAESVNMGYGHFNTGRARDVVKSLQSLDRPD